MNLIYEQRDEAKRKELGLSSTSATHNWVRSPDWSLVAYERGGGHELADFHVRTWEFFYQGKSCWLSLAGGSIVQHGGEREQLDWLDEKDEPRSFLAPGWLSAFTEAVTVFRVYDRQTLQPTQTPFRVTVSIGPLTSNEYADSVPVDPDLYSARCTYRWDGQQAVSLDS